MGAQATGRQKEEIVPKNRGSSQDKEGFIFHSKTNALKQPELIYVSESISGSQLRQAEIQDFNEYIYTKNPKQTGSKRYNRDEEYSEKASSSIKNTTVAAQNDYRVVSKKKFGYD